MEVIDHAARADELANVAVKLRNAIDDLFLAHDVSVEEGMFLLAAIVRSVAHTQDDHKRRVALLLQAFQTMTTP